MRLWRISNFADLSGDGGVAASGRWHSRGRRIVYLAEHPAAALVEILVHLEIDPDDLPTTFQLLAIDIADDVKTETVDPTSLPARWRADATATRAIGDEWLDSRRTLLLQVPSAIVPYTFNWLFNPAHADAREAAIADVVVAPFDARLLD